MKKLLYFFVLLTLASCEDECVQPTSNKEKCYTCDYFGVSANGVQGIANGNLPDKCMTEKDWAKLPYFVDNNVPDFRFIFIKAESGLGLEMCLQPK